MNDTTVISCLTPPGRAAIATIGVRGPAAWAIARALFRRRTAAKNDPPGAPLPEAPTPGKFWLGWLGDQASGGADEVVLLVRQTTPEPWLELHCHGGPEVVRLLQKCFQTRGAREVPWQDFELGCTPLWRRAAQNGLAHALTERTAAIELDQWHGAFIGAVAGCLARRQTGDCKTALGQLQKLIGRLDFARQLHMPWNVVVAGAPNVGKSSLVNALAGYTRCIVAPQPGTTRDLVTATVALDGWPVELVDTAGQRDAQEPLERAGIARAEEAAAAADVCLWILDGAAAPILPAVHSDNLLLIVNKTDLPAAWDWQARPEALQVSAKTSAGLPELCDAIVKRLVPSPPAPGEAVPCCSMQEIRTALQQGNEAEAFKLLEALQDELTGVQSPSSSA